MSSPHTCIVGGTMESPSGMDAGPLGGGPGSGTVPPVSRDQRYADCSGSGYGVPK